MAKERLVVLTGPLKDRVFDIVGAVSVGRSPDNVMHLDDLQVSRKHAIIERDGRGVMLRDLGSGNGTFVGGRRVLEYKLAAGDIIKIGQQEIRFEQEKSKEEGGDSGVRFESGSGGKVEAAKAAEVYATFFAAPAEEAAASAPDSEKLKQMRKRLQAIYAANQIIASERDLNKLFERVMDQIFQLVPAHNGVILLEDKGRSELITEYVKTGTAHDQVVISSSIVTRAFKDGEAVITFDAADDSRFGAGQSIISQNISSAMCVPLQYQDETLGVIYVDTRGTTDAFVNTDVELLVAIAGPSAVAIKNAQYVRSLEQSYSDTLIVLANAVEARDHYTVGHTWRVTNFSMEIAGQMGWAPEKIKEVQMGGVLHDVGKIAVPDAVLRKPGKLTEEEYAQIKIHPEAGARILQDVEFLHPLIPYCLYHHERYDGKGYPYGLKAEQIPIEGRLVAVADTFDALTSNRPYRKGLPPEVAIAEIEKGRGTQFDPHCADAFIAAWRAGKIDRILQDYYSQDEKSVACPFCSTHIRLPDGVKLEDEFECEVCHRQLRLQEKNDAYYAELLPQTGAVKRITTVVPPLSTKMTVRGEFPTPAPPNEPPGTP